MSTGQQTLSVEVSERTRSQMLKLEKENQSLLRTIEELRAASTSSSLRPKQRPCRDCDRVDRLVCDTNNWTPSTDELSGPQTSCSNTENQTNIFPLSSAPQQILNGDLNSHRRADTVELEGVQSEILLTDDPERHIQEKGQREERGRGDFKDLMSDLEVLENIHNRLHCFVGSRDHSPGSKSSSPCHDSIFTGLPARPSYASKHTQRLEAKCKVLDSVNQQLQTSLDNTGKNCKSNKNYTFIVPLNNY